MPRKNRRAPDEAPAPVRRPDAVAPMWALAPGFDLRRVAGDKPYRCPGCDQLIRPATPHTVAWPVVPSMFSQSGLDERRHWHTSCWKRRPK